jgi:hypothetical protein
MIEQSQAQLLCKTNEGSQSVDQKLALIIWDVALACGIDQCSQLLSAWSPFSDLARPHDNLGRSAGTGGALVSDLAGQCNDAVERRGFRVVGHPVLFSSYIKPKGGAAL